MRAAQRSESPYPDDRVWLGKARQALAMAEGQERPDLKEAAAALGCDYAAFRRRFARLAGVPPARYRLQSQVDLARSLMMKRAGISNKELASACGFADAYHFSKQFKQVVGTSPKEYRSRWRRAAAR
jgi:AraC-like DNA-binding protein